MMDGTELLVETKNPSAWAKASSKMMEDLKSYLNEYTCCIKRRDPQGTAEKIELITQLVNDNDVSVFAKDGCGFCTRAKDLLAAEKTRGGLSFSQMDVIGTAPDFRAALKAATGVPLVSFPMIFIRGVFIGGGDQLSKLVLDRRLLPALSAPRAAGGFVAGHVEWGLELQRAHAVQFFQVPRGGKWYCFQLNTYANLVRGISVLHVIIFGAMITLQSLQQTDTTRLAYAVLLWYFFLDLLLYIVFGPVPWSPLGCLTNLVCWRVRGNSITTIPYKVVFLAYVVTFAQEIFGGGLESMKLGIWTGYLVNSAALAVFRF